jgi:hypothetical protein
MCSLKFKPLDSKFDSWLPKDVGGPKPGPAVQPVDEIRVLLSWNSEQNKVERLFGQNPCPADQAGDEKLKKLIKDSYEDYQARGNAEVPLILDVGPKVPWKHVVEVFDMGRDARVKHLQFGMGTQLDK